MVVIEVKDGSRLTRILSRTSSLAGSQPMASSWWTMDSTELMNVGTSQDES
jgi:hypothetical protein